MPCQRAGGWIGKMAEKPEPIQLQRPLIFSNDSARTSALSPEMRRSASASSMLSPLDRLSAKGTGLWTAAQDAPFILPARRLAGFALFSQLCNIFICTVPVNGDIGKCLFNFIELFFDQSNFCRSEILSKQDQEEETRQNRRTRKIGPGVRAIARHG